MQNPIRHETSRWSDLPTFIEQYNALVSKEGEGVGRIFGYASIIGNHSAEKPQASAALANEKARVEGMEVAMNVYATGEFELRGTTDMERGIHNVGLYAGMEPAINENGYSEGLNITVAPQDAAQSFKAYLKREIGSPPNDMSLDELITQGKNGEIAITEKGQQHLASLKGTSADDFGLYKLQVVDSRREDGKQVPALSVSTNENSPFAAIGLSDKEAAIRILDGMGYGREVDGRVLGGSALDYFKNTMGSYEEYGVEQPRIRSIATEVVNVAEQYRDFEQLHASNASLEDRVNAANTLLHQENGRGLSSPMPSYFGGRNLVERGSPDANVKAQNDLPRTGQEKMQHIGKLLDSGAMDDLKKVRDALQQSNVSAPVASSQAQPGSATAAPAAPDRQR
jgi:hypothetical protein